MRKKHMPFWKKSCGCWQRSKMLVEVELEIDVEIGF
jgi:hypothetical protein